MVNPRVAGVIRSARSTDAIVCSTDCPGSTSATSVTVQRIGALLPRHYRGENTATRAPKPSGDPTTLHTLVVSGMGVITASDGEQHYWAGAPRFVTRPLS